LTVIFHCAAPAVGDPLGADDRADELGADEFGVVDPLVVDLLLEQPATPPSKVAAAATTSNPCFTAVLPFVLMIDSDTANASAGWLTAW
jgi:hypothetical protein